MGSFCRNGLWSMAMEWGFMCMTEWVLPNVYRQSGRPHLLYLCKLRATITIKTSGAKANIHFTDAI